MLLRLLYRTLVVDRGRTALGVLAVASAVMLLVVLEGFRVGLWVQTAAYPEHLRVQFVAAQAGVSNMTGARSVLGPEVLPRVEKVPGVGRVYPLVGLPTIFVQGAGKTPIYIVGYDGEGGPWRLRAGRNVSAPGELVMDYALARKYGLDVGDTTLLLGREFRIVGLSSGTSSLLNPFVFTRLEDAQSLFWYADAQAGQQTGFSFLLIEVAEGASPEKVRAEIERSVPEVDLFTPRELADNDVAIMKRLMGPIMDLLVAVAYVVGVLVIGLTVYASVFERLREYGVMKALGATNRRLYGYVLSQALAFALLGMVVGVLAGVGVSVLIGLLAPQYLVVAWDGGVLLRTGVSAVVMASLASVLPIRQVAGVEPTLVFRE